MVELLQKKRKTLQVGIGGRGWLVRLDLAWLGWLAVWLGLAPRYKVKVQHTRSRSGLFEDHTHGWSG